jgi:lipopolysaccharide export system permease protein
MSFLSHFLVPLAQRQLNQRELEISQNVTAGLLKEGQFLHPTDNVTFYTRLIGADGVLHDVFLSDRRNPEQGVIYTSSEAYLVRNGTGTTLILVDGLAQRLQNPTQALSTTKFRDFSFDITSLMQRDKREWFQVSDLTTPELISGMPDIDATLDSPPGALAEELNSRFAQSLFCVVAGLVGFSVLLAGGFSRFGVWREIGIAFALLIAIDGTRGSLVRVVQANADLWPVLYLPSLIGALVVVAALWQSAHPRWMRRLIQRRQTV